MKNKRSDPSKGPLVSIITPVYNRVSTLSECLRSVEAQDYSNIEHIIIDGGSTDGTVELLSEHVPSIPLSWISEPDGGMYDAINKGLSKARGEVIAYLNSDDLYLPWSVSAAVAGLREGSDLVFGDLGVFTEEEGVTRFFIQFYPAFDLTFYTHIGSIGQPTVFWRREVMERIGSFDTSYRLIGDCEYWLRVATSGFKLAHLNEILAIQIDHEETLRATQAERLQAEFERLRRDYGPLAPPPRFPKLRKKGRGMRWRLYHWRFYLATHKKHPHSWSYFIDFLRRHRVRINDFRSLLYYSLPRKWRPKRGQWAKRSDFKQAIFNEIETQSSRASIRRVR